MADPVNPTVRFHIEMIDRLLLTLRGSIRLHVALFWVAAIAGIAAFVYSTDKAGIDKFDATKAAGVVTTTLSAFPLTLVLSRRGHINVLSGFRQNLEGFLHASDLTAEIEWAIGQVKTYVEKLLGSGDK